LKHYIKNEYQYIKADFYSDIRYFITEYKKMMRIFLLTLFTIFLSCNSDPRKYEQSFDTPLLKLNEKFRLAGEYDSLVSLNRKYYMAAERLNYNEGKALCYINLAEVNISLENYQKSQILFDKAMNILKKSKNDIHKARFYNVYGRFNFELKRPDKAFEYNNEAASHIKNVRSSPLKDDLLFNIYLRQGTYFIQKKQYSQALHFFQKARKFDDTGLAECAISDYIYMHQEKDSAYKYLMMALDKTKIRGKADGIALYTYTILGEYYITNGQYDKAEESLKKALEIDKKTKRIYAYYSKYIYNDLRTLYDRKGDKESAYFYLNAYTEAKNRNNFSILKTINQDMESFIKMAKEDSEEYADNLRWTIIFTILIVSFSGVYAWRVISSLRKKRSVLKIEAEELKFLMNDKKHEEILKLARENDPAFLAQFKEAYPGFISKLLEVNPGLENSELIFCAMLKLHFTSKDIARYTFVQHKTVQQKKYRIRKRLYIPAETDIYQFFDDIN